VPHTRARVGCGLRGTGGIERQPSVPRIPGPPPLYAPLYRTLLRHGARPSLSHAMLARAAQFIPHGLLLCTMGSRKPGLLRHTQHVFETPATLVKPRAACHVPRGPCRTRRTRWQRKHHQLRSHCASRTPASSCARCLAHAGATQHLGQLAREIQPRSLDSVLAPAQVHTTPCCATRYSARLP
jgi:hypothetical protein